MTQLKCKVCKKVIVEDTDRIDRRQKFISCPYCGRTDIPNPYYEGEDYE